MAAYQDVAASGKTGRAPAQRVLAGSDERAALCVGERVSLAFVAVGVPALAHGLWLLERVAKRRNMATCAWQRVHDTLRAQVRQTEGRHKHASAGSIDSRQHRQPDPLDAWRTGRGGRGERGYDGAKHKVGRKRHLSVDTLGLLLHAVVTPANVSDTAGAVQLLEHLRRGHGVSKKLRRLWVDGGYFNAAKDKAKKQRLELCVVEKPAGQKGFSPLPKRWVVERTFAWLGKCRRLVRDYETTTQSSHTFILLAMIKLMLNRL